MTTPEEPGLLRKDLTQAMDLIRKRELQAAEKHIRQQMITQGRCPVCTLALPCKHYTAPTQLPQLRPTHSHFKVRYRSVNGSILTSTSPVTHTQRRRLKLLEKLDLYRQTKIEKTIQRLELEQKLEQKQREEELHREHRRKARQVELHRLLETQRPAKSSSPPAAPHRPSRAFPSRAELRAKVTKVLEQTLPLSLDLS